MFLLLERLNGNVEKVWVSDDEDLIHSWRDELDAEHGIERDEDGDPVEDGEWEVTVHGVDQYQITMTVNNVIALN